MRTIFDRSWHTDGFESSVAATDYQTDHSPRMQRHRDLLAELAAPSASHKVRCAIDLPAELREAIEAWTFRETTASFVGW
jgi:hypothetical protein